MRKSRRAGGRETLLWAIEDEVVDAINARHENPVFLPGVPLNPAIRATDRLSHLGECDAWLVVTPAQHMRAVLSRASECHVPMVLCAKGIEEKSGELLHKVAAEACPGVHVAVLSGPTFANEVAKGLPTAVTLAAENLALAETLRDRIAQPTFRIYVSDDLAGAEIGGAVKNVLAIACGVVEGKGLGQNARAALISRGFAEMTRFGLACGARRETSHRPVGTRRSRTHLLFDQLAQLLARQRHWRRPFRRRAARRPPHRRGRGVHRSSACSPRAGKGN